MEATPFCLLLNKLQLFRRTQLWFILIKNVPLHVCYMFRPVFRPSSGMSIQKYYKGRCEKIESKGPLFTVTIVLKC
jgi:hypothetical protein